MSTPETPSSKPVRPSWDDYFMAMCRIVATRSTCDRLHTGAVLVKDSRIISTGYNGSPQGLPHCDDVGHLMEEGHCVRTVHGEHNALLQAAVMGSASTKGSTMYTLYTPCIHCAKYIVTAGITRVVYAQVYRNSTVLEYFKTAGVETEEYEPTDQWNEEVIALFQKAVEAKEAPEVTLSVE